MGSWVRGPVSLGVISSLWVGWRKREIIDHKVISDHVDRECMTEAYGSEGR